jgi:signal transduction histidine kinase
MPRIETQQLPPESRDYDQADWELARQGLPGSLLYGVIWAAVMVATPVGATWPEISWTALILLLLSGTIRFFLGSRFDVLHAGRPVAWRRLYAAMVIAQAFIWSMLNAFLILQYATAWPAMLISFITAGLVAGGAVATLTHRALQVWYVLIMLLPSAVACWSIGEPGTWFMGALFLANLVFLIAVGQRLGAGYWLSLRNNRLLSDHARQLDEARQRAESAVEAKGRFMAKVSHELRTPLNGLLVTIEIMKQENHPARVQRHLAIMSKSADVLMLRISELLDFSKIEAGKLELEKVPFDPLAILNDLLELQSDAARAKGLEVCLDVDRIDVIPVVGDPARLMQILMNLVGNSTKFTKQGRIELGLEQTVTRPGLVACRFIVSDTGIGIAPNVQQKVFESFVQADESTNREYGGTGLGLAVSRDLAQLMGGTLQVVSATEQGSRFVLEVELPRGELAAPASETIELEDPPINDALGLRVLVAEDNEINRVIVEEMLVVLGCKCELVEDGERCFARFKAARFDCILMDCEMPGTDGFAASRWIREFESQQGHEPVPIIAVTAHAGDDHRDMARRAGMGLFVSKPFTLAELRDALLSVRDPGTAGDGFSARDR